MFQLLHQAHLNGIIQVLPLGSAIKEGTVFSPWFATYINSI